MADCASRSAMSANVMFVCEFATAFAKNPVVIHLYDLGAAGWRLVGLERPD